MVGKILMGEASHRLQFSSRVIGNLRATRLGADYCYRV